MYVMSYRNRRKTRSLFFFSRSLCLSLSLSLSLFSLSLSLSFSFSFSLSRNYGRLVLALNTRFVVPYMFVRVHVHSKRKKKTRSLFLCFSVFFCLFSVDSHSLLILSLSSLSICHTLWFYACMCTLGCVCVSLLRPLIESHGAYMPVHVVCICIRRGFRRCLFSFSCVCVCARSHPHLETP